MVRTPSNSQGELKSSLLYSFSLPPFCVRTPSNSQGELKSYSLEGAGRPRQVRTPSNSQGELKFIL